MKRLFLYLGFSMVVFVSETTLAMSCETLMPPTEPVNLTLDKFREMALFGGPFGYFGNPIRHPETYLKTPEFGPLISVIDEAYLSVAQALRWSPEQTLAFADFPGGRRVADLIQAEVIKPVLSNGPIDGEQFKSRLTAMLFSQMQMEGQLLFLDDRFNQDPDLLEALAGWKKLYQMKDPELAIKHNAQLELTLQSWSQYFKGTAGVTWKVDAADIKEKLRLSFPLIGQVYRIFLPVKEAFNKSALVASGAITYKVEFRGDEIQFRAIEN